VVFWALAALACGVQPPEVPTLAPSDSVAGGAATSVAVDGAANTDVTPLPAESGPTASPSPHALALRAMLDGKFQKREDRDGQVRVDLPDAANWKRVRFSLLDHWVGFRYGKSPDALAIALLEPTMKGERVDGRACMRKTEEHARPLLAAFDVQLTDLVNSSIQWRDERVLVRTASGGVDYGFGARYFAVAWVSYPAYKDACLTLGIAIPWDGEQKLASEVRDRWVKSGLESLEAVTEMHPVRSP
jgi:hypothetical protein